MVDLEALKPKVELYHDVQWRPLDWQYKLTKISYNTWSPYAVLFCKKSYSCNYCTKLEGLKT